MSHALYSTALLWHVTRGVAKLHGVLAAVELQRQFGGGECHGLLGVTFAP